MSRKQNKPKTRHVNRLVLGRCELEVIRSTPMILLK